MSFQGVSCTRTVCAPYALELDYRQNLIQQELTGYNADLIC